MLLAEGRREDAPVGRALTTIDVENDALYLLLDGRFEVRAPDGAVIRSPYAGDMVGEVSLLDGRAASATVITVEPAEVLRVPRRRLQARLDADPAFAARFYRAIGTLLAHRLRDLTGRRTGSPSAADVLDLETLDGADLAGRRLDLLIRRARGA